MTRHFRWTEPTTAYRIRHLIADDHKQIVAEIIFQHKGNYPFDVGNTRCSVLATGRREAGAR